MANIITIEEFESFDDSPSPIANLEQVTNAISAATSLIEKLTTRTFETSPSPAEIIEVLNGKDAPRIYTHQAPVLTVTKLEYFDGVSWVEFDSTTYPRAIKTDSNIIYFITPGHKFPCGYQNIRVTFTYGIDALPGDLKFACFAVAKHMILEASRQGLTQQADGEQTFNYTHELPPGIDKIIMRYKTVL